MIKKVFVRFLFFVLFLVLFFFAGCGNPDNSLDKSFDKQGVSCNTKSDCKVVNLDCSDCSCDNLVVIREEFANNVCKNSNVEIQCDLDCQAKEFDCIENQCQFVD